MSTGILSLPLEVLDKILTPCLVHQRDPGAEIIPHPIIDEDVSSRFGGHWPDNQAGDDEGPSYPLHLQTLSNTRYSKHHSFMSLLGVNHQLRAEAACILLAKNTFRFRIASSDDATATDHAFWQAHLQHARHLTLYFRYTDTPAARIAQTAHENRWSDMGLGGNFHNGIRNHSRLSRRDLWTQRFQQLSRCSDALSSISVNIQQILPPNQPDLPDPSRQNTLFELGDYLWYFITATWQVNSVTLDDSTSYPPDKYNGVAAKTEHRLSCAGVGNTRRSIEIVARCHLDFERLVSGWNVERDAEDVKEEEDIDVVMGNSGW